MLLLAFLLGLTGPALAQAHPGQAVVILDVRGVIDPVVAPYVKLGLDTANSTDAPLVIILLDPPGGLAAALRAMVLAILHSNIPIIVLSVEPFEVCTASAGVFMPMVARVAARWE